MTIAGGAPALDVDGARPAVALVAALPRDWPLNAADRLVLMALACDSFDGLTSAPGYEALADWTGMQRSTVVGVLARLAKPQTDREGRHRPALIARENSTRGGRYRTTWRLLLEPVGATDQLPAEPVDNSPQPVGRTDRLPVGQPVGEPVGATDRSLTLSRGVTPLPPGPLRERFERLAADRRLHIDVDELIAHAHRLGHGDLDAGYREVDERTVATLDGARDRRAVLRFRLAAPAPPPAPRRAQRAHVHDFDPVSGYCAGCTVRNDTQEAIA